MRRGEPLYKGDWEETWTVREYVYVVLIRNPLNDLLDFVKYRVLRMTYHDPHIVCYSYPNCDEAPSGCVVENGNDAEPYGHRDLKLNLNRQPKNTILPMITRTCGMKLKHIINTA